MATSKINKNIVLEDISDTFFESYSSIFEGIDAKAVKIGDKLLYFYFYAHTKSGSFVPHTEWEHIITNHEYNSSTLSNVKIYGEAHTGMLDDADKAVVIVKPDSNGIAITCDKENKRYLLLSGIFHIK